MKHDDATRKNDGFLFFVPLLRHCGQNGSLITMYYTLYVGLSVCPVITIESYADPSLRLVKPIDIFETRK